MAISNVQCPYCESEDTTKTNIGVSTGRTLLNTAMEAIGINVAAKASDIEDEDKEQCKYFCNQCGRSWVSGEEDNIRQQAEQQRQEERHQRQEERRQKILNDGVFKPIRITGDVDYPNVVLDKENNVFEISGRSLPEDVVLFYTPIFEWLYNYQAVPLDRTVFDFKLDYYNTASSNRILDIMFILEDIYNDGHDVLIRWHYPNDNEDLEERGEEYADLVKVPFEMVPYSIDE